MTLAGYILALLCVVVAAFLVAVPLGVAALGVAVALVTWLTEEVGS